MKDYFNLTIEEKKELVNKRDFTPTNFASIKEPTTTSTSTTINPQ